MTPVVVSSKLSDDLHGRVHIHQVIIRRSLPFHARNNFPWVAIRTRHAGGFSPQRIGGIGNRLPGSTRLRWIEIPGNRHIASAPPLSKASAANLRRCSSVVNPLLMPAFLPARNNPLATTTASAWFLAAARIWRGHDVDLSMISFSSVGGGQCFFKWIQVNDHRSISGIWYCFISAVLFIIAFTGMPPKRRDVMF